ncbi:MAG: hypothetical protein NVS1B5_05470 [Gemmatimonadaceae bacterium]
MPPTFLEETIAERSILAALVLREKIYRTLTAEERSLVALEQFQTALNTLLDNVPKCQPGSPRQPVK